jgi:cyanophycinase
VPGVLALVGGGEFTEGLEPLDRELLQASGGAEVVVLPTAAAYENPGKLVARAVEWFAALGATVREVPAMQRPAALDPAHIATVRSARFVYFVGGSPLHLRSVLKETPLWQAVHDAWRDGAVVAGSGESASALCDPMVDPRGGAFTMGLGLVSNLAVLPHADGDVATTHRRTLELAHGTLALAAVPDGAALVRDAQGTWCGPASGVVRVFVDGAEQDLSALP